MRTINSIRDIVDWGMCVGCGACYYACRKQAITLENVESTGIRPRVDTEKCMSHCDCVAICPGYSVDAYAECGTPSQYTESDPLFGPVLEIWQGHAVDPEIRHAGSSGGALTALALYCMEKENMPNVLHTAMDPETPYLNKTVCSTSRSELLSRTGSRYAPASPCDGLGQGEKRNGQFVFIGKPCDATAVSHLRKERPQLDKQIGLVLTFFCAGTPSTLGTLKLMKRIGANPKKVNQVNYRGNGWPGEFTVKYESTEQAESVDYETAWGNLQAYRPFRCHLCPDGLGQVADISCGDAWHTFSANGDPGQSLILIRTERGRQVFSRALKTGYLKVKPVDVSAVVDAQENLLLRRKLIFGRLLAMRLLFMPIPQLKGFLLFRNWLTLPFRSKLLTILGTWSRLIRRNLWRRSGLSEGKV